MFSCWFSFHNVALLRLLACASSFTVVTFCSPRIYTTLSYRQPEAAKIFGLTAIVCDQRMHLVFERDDRLPALQISAKFSPLVLTHDVYHRCFPLGCSKDPLCCSQEDVDNCKRHAGEWSTFPGETCRLSPKSVCLQCDRHRGGS